MKNLNVPFLSQLDNADHPHQTCNVTCAGMVSVYFGHPKVINGVQIEDVLNRAANRYGYNRYAPGDIKKLIERWTKEQGLPLLDKFNNFSNIDYIKQSLDAGCPLITHGYFTPPGHIIVLKGYDDKGCWVNDPNGEWWENGYGSVKGHNLHYSWGMLERHCYEHSDNSWWTHRISKA